MVLVGRHAGGAEPDQADDIGGGIGEGMKTVGKDADGAGRVTEDQFRAGHRQS